MNSVSKNDLEFQVLEQLREITRRRAELEAEERGLLSLLAKVRSKTVKTREVTRKNSATRILIEDRILETLRRAPEGVPTRVLGREVAYFFPSVKGATFRSYLHRLSARGHVEPAQGRTAAWQLTKTYRESLSKSD